MLNLKNSTAEIKIIASLLLMGAVATIRAAEPMELSWDRAWQLALENNDQLAGARDEVAKAEHTIGEAYASALPKIQFSGNFQHYFQVPSIIFYLPNFNDPAEPRTRIKTQFASENNASFGVQLNQPLWLAGKVGIALEIAKNYHELSRLAVAVSRSELHLSLTRAFYGAMMADEYVAVSSEAQAQAIRHRDQVKALFDQGMVSEYDLIRAQVAVANVEPQVAAATAARDLAYKTLKNLIGMDVDAPVNLVGELKAAAIPFGGYPEAVATALNSRPELRQVNLQGELYKGQFKIETRSAYWPNLYLGLFYNSQAQADDIEFSKYEFLGGWGGALSVQIPLFDGFASHHRAQKALIELRGIKRRTAELERGIKIQVHQALADYNKASLELKAARESVAQAERGVTIAETRYREGMGTQLEVLDAQLQLNQARTNRLQAEYNLIIARATYDRAVGEHAE